VSVYVVIFYQLLLRDWKPGSVLAKLGRKERNIMAPATVEVSAWAAKDSSGHLAPFTFLRR
jgi:hypothetical protein